jgi:hypothetical protein
MVLQASRISILRNAKNRKRTPKQNHSLDPITILEPPCTVINMSCHSLVPIATTTLAIVLNISVTPRHLQRVETVCRVEASNYPTWDCKKSRNKTACTLQNPCPPNRKEQHQESSRTTKTSLWYWQTNGTPELSWNLGLVWQSSHPPGGTPQQDFHSQSHKIRRRTY